MTTYTEKEIKDWFEIMKKKYPDSGMLRHLEAVEAEMFGEFHKENNLEKIKEKIIDK